eukprot:3984534-Amphidinium_carterae.1
MLKGPLNYYTVSFKKSQFQRLSFNGIGKSHCLFTRLSEERGKKRGMVCAFPRCELVCVFQYLPRTLWHGDYAQCSLCVKAFAEKRWVCDDEEISWLILWLK